MNDESNTSVYKMKDNPFRNELTQEALVKRNRVSEDSRWTTRCKFDLTIGKL